MGYYTDYELHWYSWKTQLDTKKLKEDLNEITGYEWDEPYTQYGIKWYSWKDNMKNLSLKYPEVVFPLGGNGEDEGDIWKAYYKNGKMQYAQANIIFDKFDESKLK